LTRKAASAGSMATAQTANAIGCRLPYEAARIAGQPIELNGETHAEQKGKQRQRLQLDRRSQKGIQCAIDGGVCSTRRQELREDRNAKLEHDIDREHAEQRQPAQDIDAVNPLGRRDRLR
jgi:hypothetical protein